jgi:hypothetical protein
MGYFNNEGWVLADRQKKLKLYGRKRVGKNLSREEAIGLRYLIPFLANAQAELTGYLPGGVSQRMELKTEIRCLSGPDTHGKLGVPV